MREVDYGPIGAMTLVCVVLLGFLIAATCAWKRDVNDCGRIVDECVQDLRGVRR